MSWFSVPLPNPFKSLQFSDDDEPEPEPEPESQDKANSSPSGGVKDDLSALGETIGRQFRGFAAFLGETSGGNSGESSDKLAGIKNDLAEIGGTFKTSLSLLSTNRAVSQISKLASDFLNFDDDDDNNHLPRHGHVNDGNDNGGGGDEDDDYEGEDEYEGVGITDEVLQFAAKISNRPELWTDFPLDIQPEFNMSDAQSEHASIIEELVPSLADLRSRLVSEINEKQFWVIYFILLLPRLTEDDLELLSTPHIIEARETLLQMLRSKNDTETNSENPQASDDSSNVVNKAEEVKEKVTTSESSTAPRSTESNESVSNAPKNNIGVVKEEDGKNDVSSEDAAVSSSAARKGLQSEDEVSFSDLEDDDTDIPNRTTHSNRASSPEWVQLNKGGAGMRGSQSKGQLSSRDRESEGEDWLTVDDF